MRENRIKKHILAIKMLLLTLTDCTCLLHINNNKYLHFLVNYIHLNTNKNKTIIFHFQHPKTFSSFQYFRHLKHTTQ